MGVDDSSNSYNKEKFQNILIVEDDIETLMMLFECLGKEYPFLLCSSAYHAIENLNQRDYALIFISYSLPEIDGVDLMNIIRKMRPDVDIIMLFDFAYPLVQQQILKTDDKVDFLTKPINPRIIEYTIKAKLGEGRSSKLKNIHKEDKKITYTPLELILMSRSGLLLYRRSMKQKKEHLNNKSIFAGVLTAIQEVIANEFKENITKEQKITKIAIGEINLLIHQGKENMYNLVLVGVGQNPGTLVQNLKEIMRIIDSPITQILKDNVVINTKSIEDCLINLSSDLPVNNKISSFFLN